MYHRYQNPLEVLDRVGFEALGDFLMYLHDEENDKQIYEMWLHKVVEKTFIEFKADLLANAQSKITKPDEVLLSFEQQFITDTGGGADV